jgi:hypothetical protein
MLQPLASGLPVNPVDLLVLEYRGYTFLNCLKFIALALVLMASSTSHASLVRWDVTLEGAPGFYFSGWLIGDVLASEDPNRPDEEIVDFSFEWNIGDETVRVSAGQGDVDTGYFDVSRGGYNCDYCLDSFSASSASLGFSVNRYSLEIAGLEDAGFTAEEYYVIWSDGYSAPEPSIIALFALGLFGIGFARRRQS